MNLAEGEEAAERGEDAGVLRACNSCQKSPESGGGGEELRGEEWLEIEELGCVEGGRRGLRRNARVSILHRND